MTYLVLGGPLHRQGLDTGDDPIPHYRYPIREPGELTPSFDDCTLKTFKAFDYTLIRLFDGTPVYIPCDMDISEANSLYNHKRPINDVHRRTLALESLAEVAIIYNTVKGFSV